MQEQDTPCGYCRCGCGEKTRISLKTNSAKGWTAGEPRSYVNGHNGVQNAALGPKYRVAANGCWEWLGNRDRLGYGRTWSRSVGHSVLAHRHFWLERHGSVPDTLDHLCRNPSCVNPDHLEPVTRQENVRRGVRAKLDWDAVRDIRSSSLSNPALAARYGVSSSTICNVRAGRVWPEAHAPWNTK